MKKIFWRKVTASFVALVMIITSLPLNLIMAEGTYVDSSGIGVYNHAYTESSADLNNYVIRFYYRDENDTLQLMESNAEFGIEDSEGEIVYVGVQGKFELKSGRRLNFTNNEDFCDFVDDNRIERIEIQFVESDQSNVKDYMLYGETAGDRATADAAGKRVVYDILNEQPKIDPETGEQAYHEVTDPQTGDITRVYEYEFRPVTNSDYTLSEFTSTVMDEFEVDVTWHDKGVNRPSELEFDIERKVQDGAFSNYDAGSPDITSVTSNSDVYSYTVPKYDAAGNAYTYRAQAETDTHQTYRYEVNSDHDEFTYISQREFNCKINWMQGTQSVEPKTLAEIRSYVMDNFKLVDETASLDAQGNPVEADYPFTADQIEYDFTTHTLTIKGLDEITSDGRAKVYYLTKTHSSDIGIEGTNDKWAVTAVNPGVHSSDTDKVYKNATIQNLLTGTVDYHADISWKDNANKSNREQMTDPGDVVLWRYANNPSDPSRLDKVAQVETVPLVRTDDQGNVVLDAEGKPTYLTALDIAGLDKYDKNGYEYVYYAKEKLSSGLGNYTASYTNSDGNTSYALNNGLITNRLVGTEVFTVDAQWIAAARQGGLATADFVLQQKVVDDQGNETWITAKTEKLDDEGNIVRDAQGNPIMVDNVLQLKDFSAETMEKIGEFGPVSRYDSEGNLLEFRVVQTYVTRTDKGVTGESSVTIQNGAVNQDMILVSPADYTTVTDQYKVTVTKTGSKYKFEYRLVGDICLDIRKNWYKDGEDVSSQFSSVTVPVDIDQYKFGQGYRDYISPRTEDPDHPGQMIPDPGYENISDGKTSINEDQTGASWDKMLKVPRYDETGHEYLYRVNEGTISPTHTFGTDYTYSSEYNYEFTNNIYVYTISNYFAKDDGYDYIRVKKEWQDDGETEYRRKVVVDPDNIVYTNPAEGGKSVPEERAKSHAYMSEYSMWEGYILAYHGFVENTMNATDENGHHTYNTDWFREYTEGDADSYLTITEFMNDHPEFTTREQAVEGWIRVVQSAKTGDPGTIDMTSLNNIDFNDIAGFFTNSGHHYIVQQKWDGSYLTFINTRIGVVNYKLNFNWNIGGKVITDAMVRIKGKVDGTEIYNQEVPIHNDGGIGTYYILNLPKYDSQGKIIEYEVEEIEIDGQPIQNGTVYLGTDHDKCVVQVEQDEYQVGSDSNSDDMMGVTLTNTFQDTTTMSIQKRWFDDNNVLDLRSDMYIRLLQNGKSLRPDYHWEKDTTDTLNYWKYTFTGLDKYDSNGYKYIYTVEEIPMENYKTTYYSSYNASDPEHSTLSSTNSVPDGGTITNVLYGEVVIDGKKLWDKTIPGLDKKHYPIAQIYLYRRDKYDAGNHLTPVDSQGVQISTTEIYSGDDKFRFKTATVGNYVPVSDTDSTPKMQSGSIVLPKYDNKGALITYSLDEKAINGYAFKISNDTIVNEYNGGRPVQVTVQKSWENMNQNAVYPTVKLVLHQVFFAKTVNSSGGILQTDGTYQANGSSPKLTPVETASYEVILRKDDENTHHWSYTFGEMNGNKRVNSKEDLREFAPDGTYFAYYVTEELSNYEGQTVVLNALDAAIASASGNPSGAARTDGFLGTFYKANEIYNAGTPTVQDDALGFKVKNMIQPLEINATSDPDQSVISRNASIQNSYEPSSDNFKGVLSVKKTWNNHDKINENTRNTSDFENVENYSFIVSRKTQKINSKQLFRINTYDETTRMPKVDVLVTAQDGFNITETQPMQAYDQSDQPIAQDSQTAVNYYQTTVLFDKTVYEDIAGIPVTFRIYQRKKTDPDFADNKKVEITGLAIYAQDAVKYTYTIEEETMKAYKTASPQSAKMTGNHNTAEFTLNNELKVFTLNLYKVFGKKYTGQDTGQVTTAILNPEDYSQYFNDAFVNGLRFTLKRKTEDESTYTTYTYQNQSDYTVQKSTNDNGQVIYYKTFTNLPKYSSSGKVYHYIVEENDPPTGAHYSRLYSGNYWNVGGVDAVDVTCDSDSKTYENTYVRNVFEAKQITVNKYWDDDNNADGLRPDNLRVTIRESVPSSVTVNINKILQNTSLWSQKVELPKYYYNGSTPIPGLQYGISESRSADDEVCNYNITENGYTLDKVGYETGSAGNLTQNPLSAENVLKPIDDEFYGFYLLNKKDRVDCQLTFSKNWDDLSDKWKLRPDQVYIKVLRKADTSYPMADGVCTISGSRAEIAAGEETGRMQIQIQELPVYKNDSILEAYSYRIMQRTLTPDPQNSENQIATWVQVTSVNSVQSTVNGKEAIALSFTAAGIRADESFVFKVQRKTASDEAYTDVTEALEGKTIEAFVAGNERQEIVKTDNAGNPVQAAIGSNTYTVDSATGVITLPVPEYGNFNAVLKNLSYGENLTGAQQDNGSWQPYYYTIVECDKNGNATDTVLNGYETNPTGTDNISKKLHFVLDISSYKQETPVRESINIKITRNGGQLVKKDVTGAPVKVTIDGVDYYCSDHLEGVIVIPVNAISDTIDCVVDNLAYSDGNGSTPYTYAVARCKADNNASTHPTSLVFVNQGTEENPVYITETVNTKPVYTSFYFIKRWSSTDDANTLRPDKVFFRLYRTTEGENKEIVTAGADGSSLVAHGGTYKADKQMFEVPVNTDYVSATIYSLPNGIMQRKTDLNPTEAGADGVWKKYQYFIVECDEDGNEITANSPSNNPYSWEQTMGEEKPFTLVKESSVYTRGTLSEGLINTLQKKDFNVEKVWNDANNENNSREPFMIQLLRREGEAGAWETVTFKNDGKVYSVTTDSGSGIHIMTPLTLTNGQTTIECPVDQLNLCFKDLPVYSPNGSTYQYRAIETAIGNKVVDENRPYMFTLDNTYVTRLHRGTANYQVDYDNDDDYTTITNSIVTNPVTYIKVKAQKVWNDENNLYGKRPDTIYYTLTRSRKTKEDGLVPDSGYSNSKPATEAQNWTADWKQCAAFDREGVEFEYEVNETAVTDYDPPVGTQTITMDNGDLTKTYTFTNTYAPQKKTLTVTKNWDDFSNIYQLRPDKIRFTLWCEYAQWIQQGTDQNGVAQYVQDDDDYVGTAALSVLCSNDDYLGSSYEYVKTVNVGAADTQSVTFEDLPAWINPCATGVIKGVSVPVTYYVKEELLDSENNVLAEKQSKDYISPANSDKVQLIDEGAAVDNKSEITNQLNVRDIIVTKIWQDNGYAQGRQLHYDLDITLSSTNFSCTTDGRNDGSNHYSETKALPKDYDAAHPEKTDFPNAVIFRNLPRYLNGAEIAYAVTETLAAETVPGTLDHLAAADLLTEEITSTESQDEPALYQEELTYTLPTNPAATRDVQVTKKAEGTLPLTGNDRKYGYNGSWESYKTTAAEGAAEDPTVVRFKLINDLPVAEFKAELYWDDDHNRDGKRLDTDGVVLSRDNWQIRTQSTETLHTDWDYIYFTDPLDADNKGGNWAGTTPDPGHMYMYLFNSQTGTDNGFPGVQAVDSYVNEFGQNVYKFAAPSDTYDKVVFNNGQSVVYSGNQTIDLSLVDSTEGTDFRHGYGYYPTSKQTADGADKDKFLCVVRDEVPNPWCYAPNASVSYRTDGRTIQIDMSGINTTDRTQADLWDDPHIYFLDSNDQVIGQASPGYLLPASGEVKVPMGAAKFVLNNGNKKDSMNHRTAATALTPGYTYTLEKNAAEFELTGSGTAQSEFIQTDAAINVAVSELTEADKNTDNTCWIADFGVQPIYSECNKAYTYRISELEADRDASETTVKKLADNKYSFVYSSSITMDDNGSPVIHDTNTEQEWSQPGEDSSELSTSYQSTASVSTVTFAVRNTYTPEKASIRLTKQWLEDAAYENYTRPSSMTFKLYCAGGNVSKTLVSSQQAAGILGQTFADTYTVSADSWQTVISGLPIYTNPDGTAVTEGSSSKIQYYLVEDAHPGYIKSGDDTAIELTTDGDTVDTTVSNKLRLTWVDVKKKWVDHGHTGTHYAVDATIRLNYRDNLFTRSVTIPKDSAASVRTSGLPLYTADGQKATYHITENTFKYQYADSYDQNDVEGESTVTITNTLPVTDLRVNKAWSDSNDTYHLRPDNITVSVDRAVSASGTWESVSLGAPVTRTKTESGNQWTITYGNLLQYNENGDPYLFKVTESAIPAYQAVIGTAQTASTGSGVTYSVDLSNELITGKLTVIKHWDDQDNTESQHYNEAIQVDSQNAATSSGQIQYTGTISSSAKLNDQSTEINNVPVYDRSGAKISYLVTETTTPQKYGYYLTTAGNALRTELNEVSGVYTGTVTLTNKLPVTSVTVIKNWDDMNDAYRLRPNSVSFQLYRTTDAALAATETTGWEAVGTDQTISGPGWTYTFDHLLKYAEDGTEYRYKVKEVYSNGMMAYKELTPQATARKNDGNADRAFTLNFENELKTRDITVTKNWSDAKYGSSLRYDVDMTLSCGDLTSTQASRQDAGGKYLETKQMGTANTQDVTYEGLPYCDNDGNVFSYHLEENISGTSPAGVNTETFRQGSGKSGYQASYTTTSADGVVTGFTVTNTLPLTMFKVTKTWNDSRNQDDIRPASLEFYLRRSTDGTTTGGELVATKTAVKEENWTSAANGVANQYWMVDFGYQPTKNPTAANAVYTYWIEEAAVASYTKTSSTQSIDDNDGVNGTQYDFTNAYTPSTGNLQVTKTWNDTVDEVDYSEDTRPSSVILELYCQYNGSGLKKVADDSEISSLYSGDTEKTASAAGGWIVNFTGLPLKVNPQGTKTKNGTAYPITYTVREKTVPNGYTPDYTSSELTKDDTTSISVTNTLQTQDITVKKVWDDSGYTRSDKAHYDVNVTVTSAAISHFSKSTTIPQGNTDGMTITYLPIYDKNGNKAAYSIVENTQHYGYNASYDITPFQPADKQVITVTNKLPLTSVKVDKTWDDFGANFNGLNFRSFRPDSITLKLYRTTKASPAADDPVVSDNKADTGWQLVATQQVTGNTDTWSYTFNNLLKLNEDNQPYVFKVEEDAVSAYKTTYTTQITSASDTNLAITNQLIARDVTVKKVWDDSGYGDSLHYPINVTLKNGDDSLSFDSVIPLAGSVIIPAVPVYDRSNTPIVYTVDENTQKYGYERTGTTTTTYTEPVKNTGGIVDSYTITNKLPVTYIRVNKSWEVDETFHQYADSADRTIELDLSRSVQNVQDTDFNNANKNISVAYTSTDMHYLTAPVLVYDVNNNPYTYKVKEHDQLGYTTSYKVGAEEGQTVTAAEHTAAAPQNIDITNTQITGDANIQKIDGTYYTNYHEMSGYTDNPINDAYFRLYTKNGVTEIPVPVTEQADGSYLYDAAKAGQTDCNLVKSRTFELIDGKIILKGLPLNTYYLKEDTTIAPPHGYVRNDAEYSFTVDVQDAADKTAETAYDNRFIGNGTLKNKIGNSQTVQHTRIDLTKVDKTDNTIKLKDATYYLLRLIPYETRITAETNEPAYLTAAKEVVRTSGGSYTASVQRYWDKVDYSKTKADGTLDSYVDLIFGTYTFMEVQAPVGYEIDNTLEPQVIDSSHFTAVFVHQDPRKDPKVKIYKQDEFGNPLNGAEFELWYRPTETQTATTYTYEYQTSDITPPNRNETQVITPRTDNDYIFFKDNQTSENSIWKSVTIDGIGELQYNDGITLKARFYDAADYEIGTYNIWERFVHYEDSKVIWKIQPPDGATQVQILSNDGTYDKKCTEKFTFRKGEAYYKSGKGPYNDNYDWETPVGRWNWSTTIGTPAKSYEPTANKVVFKLNHRLCWDNVHIMFFDSQDNVIGQPFPGYLMEPYGYAGSDYKLGGKLCYELTIPQGATHFQINNGIGTDYNDSKRGWYYTAKTALDLTSSDKKNYNNYWKFDSDHADWYHDGTLTKWSDSEITEGGDTVAADTSLVFEEDSDYDYIYFEDTENWAGASDHMYAYYYGGDDLQADNIQRACYSVWPGIPSVARFRNSDGKYVYKFRRPMGDNRVYSSVIFNNGHTVAAGGANTATIKYNLGKGYTAFAVAWDQYLSSYLNTRSYTQRTYTDGGDTKTDYLYILNSSTNPWDDMHVVFYNEQGTVIHQDGVGYAAKDSDTNAQGSWYRISIPTDAKQFSLNNGYNKGSYERTTPLYSIDSHVDRADYEADPSAYEDRNDYTLDNIMFSVSDTADPEIAGGKTYQLTKLHPTFIATAHTQTVTTPSAPAAPVSTHTVNQPTDYDYIYFTDPHDNGGTWVSGTTPDITKMYLYCFGDGGVENARWPGENAVGSYLNDSLSSGTYQYQNVYRFPAPSSSTYTGIVFNNNSIQTKDIATSSGTNGVGYYTSYRGTDGKYVSLQWTHTTQPSVSYESDGQTISFEMNIPTQYTGDNTIPVLWDDPHIYFLDENQQAIGQANPGYLLTEDGTVNGNKKYSIEIPVGAKYFVLNNGNTAHKAAFAANQTTVTEITPGYTYSFDMDGAVYMREGSSYLLKTPDPVVPQNEYRDGDILLAKVRTGDDGLNAEVYWTNPAYPELITQLEDMPDGETAVIVKEWGTYYWKEVTKPTGYTANEEILTTFTLEAGEADKTVNIIKANNTRIKGKVTLTKIAQQSSGNIAIGSVLPGAVFELYRSDGTPVITAEESGVFHADQGDVTQMTTDAAGQIVIDNLDWGRYYLLEKTAPTGFTKAVNPVYFTVGRNNCEQMQQLTCKDPTEKAKISVSKEINKRIEAWGDPTFIFRIVQKQKYVNGSLTAADNRQRVISLTLDNDRLTGSTEDLTVDPGVYEISEISVSRYEFENWSYSIKQNGTEVSSGSYTNSEVVTLTVNADQKAEVHFENTLAYYDKFSHVDAKVNRFHGDKGIRVVYNDPVSADSNPAIISKSALNAYFVHSDGSETPMTAEQKNLLNFTYLPQPKDDTRFADDFTSTADALSVSHPERYTDGVYRLRATAPGGFTYDFEINFAGKNHDPKEYEKTFIFKADEENRSYFEENSIRSSQYALTFTMVKDGNGGYKVYSVKHDGEVVAEGSNISQTMDDTVLTAMRQALIVNEAYRSSISFDHWDKDGVNTTTLSYSMLETLAKSGGAGTVIYKAVLA